MRTLTKGVFGEYYRWPESRSVQQLVCCLALNALDLAAQMRLAMPRLSKQRLHEHKQDLADAEAIHRLAWQLSDSVGGRGAKMSAGMKRSLERGVGVLKEQVPGTTLLEEVKPGDWRALHSAADYIVYDVMFSCPVWTRKAPAQWQELAGRAKAMWERHNMFPKAEDRGEDIRFLIKCRAGYYTN